jgi:hypothetical protein
MDKEDPAVVLRTPGVDHICPALPTNRGAVSGCC